MNQSNDKTVDTLIDALLEGRDPHYVIGYMGAMITRYMEADDSVADNVNLHIDLIQECK